jgi:hypothetical protein
MKREEEPPLLELHEDKWKDLKSIRDFIRLPVMYHPSADVSGQPPGDISALKLDAIVEECVLLHELDEIQARVETLQDVIPPMSLGGAAVSFTASEHVLRKKRKIAE